MFTASAVETDLSYVFTVTDGQKTFVYEWVKQPPEGQTTEDYLQNCKREALLLAELEVTPKPTPTPIDI